jgi:hypothetical protein
MLLNAAFSNPHTIAAWGFEKVGAFVSSQLKILAYQDKKIVNWLTHCSPIKSLNK